MSNRFKIAPIFQYEGRDTCLHLSISEDNSGKPYEIFLNQSFAGSESSNRLCDIAKHTSNLIKDQGLEKGIDYLNSQEEKTEDRIRVLGVPGFYRCKSEIDFVARFLALNYQGDLSVADNKVSLDELRGYQTGFLKK